MTNRMFEVLWGLWQTSPKETDALVFGIKDNFKKSFASACKDAKIEDLHFHDYRHSGITRLINLGIPPMEIMKISGHSQLSTFLRYLNPEASTIQNIAERLSASQNQSIINSEVNKLIN